MPKLGVYRYRKRFPTSEDGLTCTRIWQACDAIWNRPSCRLRPVCSEPPPIFRPKNDISIASDTPRALMHRGHRKSPSLLLVDRRARALRAGADVVDVVVSVVRLQHHARRPHRYLSAKRNVIRLMTARGTCARRRLRGVY